MISLGGHLSPSVDGNSAENEGIQPDFIPIWSLEGADKRR